MKIENYTTKNWYNNNTSPTIKPSVLRLRGPLKADTVSFGYLNEIVPKDIQLYRSISEEELKNLLNGEIFSFKYATSSPKGWLSKNWENGYVYAKKKPVYFITFKTNVLNVSSCRDSKSDTRYSIEKYSIKDIKNIRKGNNALGEIVYAKNLEKAKVADKKYKKERMSELEKILANPKNKIDKADAWDELSCLASQFPSLIKMEKYVDYNDASDINNFAHLIEKTDKKELKPLFNKCIKTLLAKNMEIKLKDLSYYAKYGDSKDLDIIFRTIDTQKEDSLNKLNIPSKFLKDTADRKRIIDKYKTNDNNNLLVLANCLKGDNENGKHMDLFREILSKYIQIKNKNDDFETYSLYSFLLELCSDELAKFGTPKDIELLKKFISKETPNHYPCEEAFKAINAIKFRHRCE